MMVLYFWSTAVKKIYWQSTVLMMLSSSVLALDTSIKIDGKLDEPQWQNAQKFEDYVQSFPNTGDKPQYSTTTLLFTTEQGIYVGFINKQPIRSRRYSGHDQYTSADFNMVFIDFNRDGNTAYEFVSTLGGGTMDGTYSRGNHSNRDWDGPWLTQVSEDDEHWYSEFFIPWTTTTYKSVNAQLREISIYFQRFNVVDSQAYSFPDTSRGRKGFTYEFEPVTVNNFTGSSYKVSSYISSQREIVTDKNVTDVGIDLVYKPTENQQIIAAINPDFGQIESDELVVNYSAIETLRTDKRPFFTENQALFDVQGPEQIKLVNTRRIGASAEQKSDELHDIALATKYINAQDWGNLGLLAVKEKDVVEDDGKTFISGRWLNSGNSLRFGQLVNYVDNPAANRRSYVTNFDLSYDISETSRIFSNVFVSDIEQDSVHSRGKGFTTAASYVPVRYWQNNVELVYLDEDVYLNDFGYQQRNNLMKVSVNSQYDDTQFAKSSAILRSRYYLSASYSENLQHDILPTQYYASIYAGLRDKQGFRIGYRHFSGGVDDLITRGVGKIYRPKRHDWHLYYASPTPANFSYTATVHYFQEGVSGWANKINLTTRNYFTDDVRLDLSYLYIDSDDWLVGNSLGHVNQYQRRLNQFSMNLVSKISDNSDLIMNAQWFALNATGKNQLLNDGQQCCRFNEEEPNDFSSSRLSFQLRYRLQLSNTAKFYLVYRRHGLVNNNEVASTNDLFSDAMALTQKNNVTAKLSYSF